jgi:hypothetical protein
MFWPLPGDRTEEFFSKSNVEESIPNLMEVLTASTVPRSTSSRFDRLNRAVPVPYPLKGKEVPSLSLRVGISGNDMLQNNRV